MKARKVMIAMISAFGVLFYFSMVHLPNVSAEDEIKIDVLPGKVLFDVDNMKPGDWAPRTVVIKNNGISAFDYQTTLKPDGKSMKLYKELLLEVKDSQQALYKGKLADFNSLSARNLKPSSEEELQFTVRVPEHLGNEFQGLDAKFTLTFSAKGIDSIKDEQVLSGMIGGSGNPGTGAALPQTATNIFNFFLIGGILFITGGLLVLYNSKRIKRVKG